jgi:hypothetical protein
MGCSGSAGVTVSADVRPINAGVSLQIDTPTVYVEPVRVDVDLNPRVDVDVNLGGGVDVNYGGGIYVEQPELDVEIGGGVDLDANVNVNLNLNVNAEY